MGEQNIKTQQTSEITHVSSTLPRHNKHTLHDDSGELHYQTLPTSRTRAHVQFNDTPTILNPTASNSPIHSDTSNPDTPHSVSDTSTQSVNSPSTIRVKSVNLSTTSEPPTNNNNNSIPPPVNFNTLPPRSSLIFDIPTDSPLNLITPAITTLSTENTPLSCDDDMANERPISIIGNIIHNETAAAAQDESILVSATYSCLPSPHSVPSPLEILSSPIQTAPVIAMSPNVTIPMQNTNYSTLPTYSVPMFHSPAARVATSSNVQYVQSQFAPTQSVMFADPYAHHQPVHFVPYPYIPITDRIVPATVPENQLYMQKTMSYTDIRQPPPVPVKPNRFSAHFATNIASKSAHTTPVVQTPAQSAPVNINMHATSGVEVTESKTGTKLSNARILDIQTKNREVGFIVVVDSLAKKSSTVISFGN